LAAGFLDGVQVCASVSGDRGSGKVAVGGEWSGGRGDEREADGLKSGFELAGFEVESGVHGVLLGSGQIRDGCLTDTDFNVFPGLLNEPEVVGQMGLQFGGLDLHVTKLVWRVGLVKIEVFGRVFCDALSKIWQAGVNDVLSSSLHRLTECEKEPD
jgi:hypothetical protein